jgi:hypothetical protein
MTIRVLVFVVGLLVGVGVYSYGTFHSLVPTKAEIQAVANCGETGGQEGGKSRENAAIRTDDGSSSCLDSSGTWRVVPSNDAPFFLGLSIAFVSALFSLHRTRWGKWASSSRLGHLTFGFLLFGIPMSLLGLHLNLVEGTLTLNWGIHVVVYAVVIGTLTGLVVWYIVTAPLIRKRGLR